MSDRASEKLRGRTIARRHVKQRKKKIVSKWFRNDPGMVSKWPEIVSNDLEMTLKLLYLKFWAKPPLPMFSRRSQITLASGGGL